jgi:Ca2+:H+ antiporter
MLSGGEDVGVLARDTVYAAVMIVCNGVVGLCLLVGGIRHRVLTFRIDGTGPALSVLTALATLTLVLPAFTTSTPGPTFSTSQLVFAGVASLVLYGVFVFVQTVRHREYFLPPEGMEEETQASPPPARGGGIGSQLLTTAIAAAHEYGCRRITLLTDRDNAAAQRFYARHGFTASAMLPMRLHRT